MILVIINKELENVLSNLSCFGLKKAPHISELYSNTGRTKVSNSFLTALIWAPVWTSVYHTKISKQCLAGLLIQFFLKLLPGVNTIPK